MNLNWIKYIQLNTWKKHCQGRIGPQEYIGLIKKTDISVLKKRERLGYVTLDYFDLSKSPARLRTSLSPSSRAAVYRCILYTLLLCITVYTYSPSLSSCNERIKGIGEGGGGTILNKSGTFPMSRSPFPCMYDSLLAKSVFCSKI